MDALVEEKSPFDRRTYRLGILNGALFMGSLAFSHPSRVLSGLILRLGGSTRSIGLLLTLMEAGWLLPQLLLARWIQSLPFKKPIYVFSVFWRLGFWGLLLLAMGLWSHDPPRLLMALFLCSSLYSLGDGFAGLPFFDIVGKAVPPHRRGSFFGWRRFLGGLIGIGGGFVVRWALSERSGIPFPWNYAFLLGIAYLLVAVALVAFCFVRERPGRTKAVPAMALYLKEGGRLLKAYPAFRMLLAWRWVGAFAGVAGLFYPSFALKRLQVPEASLGWFITLGAISSTFSNLYWARISDRRGNRSLLRRSALLNLLAASLALLSSLLSPASHTLAYGLLLAVLLLSDAAIAGEMIGDVNYLLEVGKEEERPVVIGFMNAFTFPLVLLPLLAGQLLQRIPYEALFAGSLLARLLNFTLSWHMTEPRENPLKGNFAPEERKGNFWENFFV